MTDRVWSDSSVEIKGYLGSDLQWMNTHDSQWELPGGHRWQPLVDLYGLRSGEVPYSRVTGELKNGSALSWTIKQSQENTLRYSYVSRWEFTIQAPVHTQ